MEIDQGEALGIRTMRDVLKRAVGHLSVRNGGVLPEVFFLVPVKTPKVTTLLRTVFIVAQGNSRH